MPGHKLKEFFIRLLKKRMAVVKKDWNSFFFLLKKLVFWYNTYKCNFLCCNGSSIVHSDVGHLWSSQIAIFFGALWKFFLLVLSCSFILLSACNTTHYYWTDDKNLFVLWKLSERKIRWFDVDDITYYVPAPTNPEKN